MSELRKSGFRRYSSLRKDKLIDFLRNSIRMEIDYNSLRLVELRALVKERGLQDYYRSKKVELIAFLRDMSEPLRDEPTPSVSPRPRSIDQPSRPTRPPPSAPEDLFVPYELERDFKGAYCSFRINGRSRMDVEAFLGKTGERSPT